MQLSNNTWTEVEQAVQPVNIIGSVGDWRYEVTIRYPPVHPIFIRQQSSIQLPASRLLAYSHRLCSFRAPHKSVAAVCITSWDRR